MRDGKGRKERVTVIPAELFEPVAARLADTRRLHDGGRSRGSGLGGVAGRAFAPPNKHLQPAAAGVIVRRRG